MANKTFEEKRIESAQRLGIDPSGIPRHVAIIMDGNGRWAVNRGLPRFKGHEQGAHTVETIAMHAVSQGIECMTLYSFSMQNWKRPKEEIDFLMYLYATYLEGIRPTLMEHNVRLVHLGREHPLPQSVIDALHETIEITSSNTGMALALALNYGSRTEIIDAVRSIVRECMDGTLNPDQIDETCIDNHLYTAGLPELDLMIRTSGEMRISNYLLWQLSYSEFHVTDLFWPDFDTDAFDEAIRTYANRSRRFGDVKSQKS